MSAATRPPAAAAPAHRTTARPPLGRLTLVELRKAVDTRAGRWLMIITAVVSLAVAAAQVFAGGEDAGTYARWLARQQTPFSFLVPVLAILVVTSEWGARTALGTFTLVPRRQRVLVAKLAAVGVLTVIAFVLAAAATAIGTALGSAVQGVPADWSLTWWQVLQPLAVLALNVAVGFSLGLLLLNAAGAIVVFFVVPIALPLLFLLVAGLRDAGPWIDYSTALQALSGSGRASGVGWLRVAVSAAIWSLLPAAIGARRVQRAEIA